MENLSFAVAPSSVEILWSQLHPALLSTFVLNTVSIITHYIYSTCQELYLFEAVCDLQVTVQYYYIEVFCSSLC
jgi:hypothetical protein